MQSDAIVVQSDEKVVQVVQIKNPLKHYVSMYCGSFGGGASGAIVVQSDDK